MSGYIGNKSSISHSDSYTRDQTDASFLKKDVGQIVFNSVADMKAATFLKIGDKVRTLGYYLAGDGGGNDYEIVAAGTGVDDGGSYIDLSGISGQAKGLFLSTHIRAPQFGAAGDGTTDDTTALKAAIAYAESLTDVIGYSDVARGKILIDLCGKLYGISDTLQMSRQFGIRNGSLVALAEPTTTSYMIKMTGERASIVDVDLDGGLDGLIRYADLIWIDAPRVSLTRVTGLHYPSYGIRVTSGSQEAFLNTVSLREWKYNEIGTSDGTLRTAKSLSVEDADCTFHNVICAQSLYPLYVTGPLNIFTGCHFYNGASTTTTEDVCALIDNADNNIFTGCYFDNGNLIIKDSFNHNLTGCHFQTTAAGTASYGILLDTSASNENAGGLKVTGCSFNGGFPGGVIGFGGSGTYTSDEFKRISWTGNFMSDGTPAWYLSKTGNAKIESPGYELLSGIGDYYELRGIRGIRIAADYDNTSGESQSNISFAIDGADAWQMNAGRNFYPIDDSVSDFGTLTNRLDNVYSNRFTLVDGITEPFTIAGHAQMYIDSADGDLKIRFGDGTIKTIMTDT